MCSHYQALKEREKYLKVFGVEPPPEDGKLDMWTGYLGAFIRKHPNADVGDDAVPKAEAVNGLFGLVPHWATDTKITKSTYNCRSETAAQKPSFREAFKRNQRCIIPVDAFYEPDWRSGRAVPTCIERIDAEPHRNCGSVVQLEGSQGRLGSQLHHAHHQRGCASFNEPVPQAH